MSTRLIVALLATLFTAPSLMAGTSLANRGLRCVESITNEEGDDVALGNATIRFGADGKANHVRVVRPKTDRLPALNETLLVNNSKIVDVIHEGVVEGVYDGEKQYSFGIASFQQITASRGDFKITISVDDHMYVGHYGSTMIFQKAGKVEAGLDDPSTGGATVSCTVSR